MIQRKQSLWLLLAALFSAGVLYFSLYTAPGATGTTGNVVLRAADHYPSLIIAVVMVLLPLISIFMFKNRKRQTSMTFVSILANIAFVGITLSRVTNLGKLMPPPAPGSYGIGAILPVVSIVLLVLALLGIRKDDKLVKSMDRLR